MSNLLKRISELQYQMEMSHCYMEKRSLSYPIYKQNVSKIELTSNYECSVLHLVNVWFNAKWQCLVIT